MNPPDFNETFEYTPDDLALMVNCLSRGRVTSNWREGDRKRLESITGSLVQSLNRYKELLFAQLRSLGHNKYMEGDGILRVPLKMQGAKERVEYRAFGKGLLGTSYIGTYESVRLAKQAWRDWHAALGNVKDISIPDIIDVYYYSGSVLVQWVDLELDPVIRANVMNLPSESRMLPPDFDGK